MPISSVGTVTGYSPGLEMQSAQKINANLQAATQLASSLPGSGDRSKNSAPVELKRLMADIENVSQTFNKKLRFVVDHNSNEVIVKVVDKDTDKVIRVIPPEELQRLHRRIKETIGFLFNERV